MLSLLLVVAAAAPPMDAICKSGFNIPCSISANDSSLEPQTKSRYPEKKKKKNNNNRLRPKNNTLRRVVWKSNNETHRWGRHCKTALVASKRKSGRFGDCKNVNKSWYTDDESGWSSLLLWLSSVQLVAAAAAAAVVVVIVIMAVNRFVVSGWFVVVGAGVVELYRRVSFIFLALF